jgi:hypothetical protein
MQTRDDLRTLLLLAVVGIGAMWSVSAGALTIAQCAAQPLLRCGTSNYNRVDPWATAMLLASVIVALLVYRAVRFADVSVLLYAVALGVVNRAFRFLQLWVSDVVSATREALGVLFAGGNPYLHDYLTTLPAHSPFPYLPGELLFYALPYALFHSIDNVDRATGIATVVLLATLAPIVGVARAAFCVALYATFELSAATSVDGTNDGGAAFVLLAAAVALAWAEYARSRASSLRIATVMSIVSAVFLAWALLFKATTWPFFPFFAIALWRRNPNDAKRYMVLVGTIVVLAIVPFLFPDPTGFLVNVYRGFVFNQYFYGLTIWTALTNAGAAIDPAARGISILFVVAVIGMFLALVFAPARSIGDRKSVV